MPRRGLETEQGGEEMHLKHRRKGVSSPNATASSEAQPCGLEEPQTTLEQGDIFDAA